MAEVKTYKCASCGYECKHYSGRGFFSKFAEDFVCRLYVMQNSATDYCRWHNI